MHKERIRKLKTLLLMGTLLLILGNKQEVLAEGEYLIVRIVDADYPPEIYINEELNLTLFGFRVYYQIENPTNTTINMDYICSPIPFPWLEVNLWDANITASLGLGIEWVGGSYGYAPGIHEGDYLLTMEFNNYASDKFPRGEYILWFNFTDCCSVSVPVVVEKMHIYSYSDKIVYAFFYDNSTEVYNYPLPTETETDETMLDRSSIFLITILIVIGNSFKKRKKSRKIRS